MFRIIIFFSFFIPFCLKAQYAPQAGLTGSLAIHADSSAFLNWASGYSLKRGWQNMADTSLGRADVGEEWSITGKAGNGVISLGDKGSITLTFPYPIRNGQGADFAVFENGFLVNDSLAFLELAFVEVSSNGADFVRFAAVSTVDISFQQPSFSTINAKHIHNLAGKYILPFGTPFDLEELKDSIKIDVNNITHVRVTDVGGSILPEWASRDVFGRAINDPWPTPFPSAGFDFDAVGVIYQQDGSGIAASCQNGLSVFPNPARVGQQINIEMPLGSNQKNLQLMDMNGKEIQVVQDKFTLETPGIYFLSILANGKQGLQKLIVTP